MLSGRLSSVSAKPDGRVWELLELEANKPRL